MIYIQLDSLYKEIGKTQKQVSIETGIREATLSGLRNNVKSSIDLNVLNTIVEYFRTQHGINDMNRIIAYIPDEEISVKKGKVFVEEEVLKKYSNVYTDKI